MTVPVLSQGDPAGPVLLLVHAWCESAGVFDRLVPRLPPWLQVIGFDQRGHGRATRPERGYRLADFAADVVALLDALNVADAVLLGSSSGGYVAQEVCRTHPERVRGLVLVGSPRDLSRRPSFADEVEALTDPLDPAWVRASLSWFPLFASVPEWYVEARVHDALETPAVVWRETLKGLMDARPPSVDARLRGPGLVIWGERDDLLSRADEEALTAAIDGAELHVYPRTGHLVLWEQPEQVAGDAVRFVEAVRTQRTR